MDEPISNDQQAAREIIRQYMTDSGCGVNELARQAGVSRSILSRFLAGKTSLQEGSALRIYCAIERYVSVMDRRRFLKCVGLLPLALVLGRDWDLMSDLAVEAHGMGVPHDRLSANRLLVAGHEIAQQGLWEPAIEVLHQAEREFGRASSQAANTAVDAAQMFINLGDYEAALQELQRVEREYSKVMDPETRANLYTRRGWLDYYLGNLNKAVQQFQAVLDIANEYGLEYLESVRHFLGRTFRDLGAQQGSEKTRVLLLHTGAEQFGKAFKVHSRWGTESDQAFDLLRLSELHVLREDWRSARELRERARQMFGDSLATLHIELDEAELALRDGEVQPAGVKAEKALEGFSHIKYAKGISRALHLLGEQAHLDGHVEEAIGYYVAALTVFPYENSPAHPNTRQWLDQALWQLRFHGDPDALRHEVRLLHEMAEKRTGPFRQLDHTSADRTEALTAILRRLSGRGRE